jgi:quinol monooxygenase YgiN
VWEHAPWPHGLLSYNLFVGTDGDTVLHYSQWASDESYREFVRTDRAERVRAIDAAVPGIARHAVVSYRLYRSTAPDSTRRTPGCIVVVSVEFDGPDEQRQRRWVDAVFDALAAETEPHPGGIAAHFHLSTDGTRVLNYAEWTSEEAHRDAIEKSGQGAVGSGPKWRRVQRFPGMIAGGYKRYHPYRSLVRPQRPNEA